MNKSIKGIMLLACSATALSVFAPFEANAAKMINHWGFDSFNGTEIPKTGDAIKIVNGNLMTNSYKSGSQWDLKVGSHGATDHSAASTLRPNGMLQDRNPEYYPHEYRPDSLLPDGSGSYGSHVALGGTAGVGGNYLHATGNTLDFKQSWAYSVVSWVNPEVSHGGTLALFSIGDSQKGFSFGYDAATQSLQFYMYKDNGSGGFEYDRFTDYKLSHAFTGSSSNWHHVGFSISNENGRLTVNYYVEGKITHTEAKSNSLLAGDTLNGFTVGSSGVAGTNIGSSNYDDIKMFEGVLTEQEATEAIRPGAVPSPAIPEPTTASLALLGLVGMAFRRRR